MPYCDFFAQNAVIGAYRGPTCMPFGHHWNIWDNFVHLVWWSRIIQELSSLSKFGPEHWIDPKSVPNWPNSIENVALQLCMNLDSRPYCAPNTHLNLPYHGKEDTWTMKSCTCWVQQVLVQKVCVFELAVSYITDLWPMVRNLHWERENSRMHKIARMMKWVVLPVCVDWISSGHSDPRVPKSSSGSRKLKKTKTIAR